jgi:hypothetical protein
MTYIMDHELLSDIESFVKSVGCSLASAEATRIENEELKRLIISLEEELSSIRNMLEQKTMETERLVKTSNSLHSQHQQFCGQLKVEFLSQSSLLDCKYEVSTDILSSRSKTYAQIV